MFMVWVIMLAGQPAQSLLVSRVLLASTATWELWGPAHSIKQTAKWSLWACLGKLIHWFIHYTRSNP